MNKTDKKPLELSVYILSSAGRKNTAVVIFLDILGYPKISLQLQFLPNPKIQLIQQILTKPTGIKTLQCSAKITTVVLTSVADFSHWFTHVLLWILLVRNFVYPLPKSNRCLGMRIQQL